MTDTDLYLLAFSVASNKARNEYLARLLSEYPESDFIGYSLEMKMSDENRLAFCKTILDRSEYNNEQVLFVMWHGDNKSKLLSKELHEKHWQENPLALRGKCLV